MGQVIIISFHEANQINFNQKVAPIKSYDKILDNNDDNNDNNKMKQIRYKTKAKGATSSFAFVLGIIFGCSILFQFA